MIQGVIEILLDASAVTTLVGNKSAQSSEYKIYPVVATQGETAPYIIAAKTPGTPLQMKGQGSDLDTSNFQLLIYGDTYELIDDIHEACRIALDNKTSVTDNGINFDRIWFTGDYDSFDKEAQKLVRIANYSALHKRSLT